MLRRSFEDVPNYGFHVHDASTCDIYAFNVKKTCLVSLGIDRHALMSFV